MYTLYTLFFCQKGNVYSIQSIYELRIKNVLFVYMFFTNVQPMYVYCALYKEL